jgi:membrane protein DedA with SNARE-associated domain
MLDFLLDWVGNLGYWSYLVIFLVVALECQAGLGLVMPGESMVMVGSFLAERGMINLPVIVIVISLAAILGDSIGYELGLRFGKEWLVRYVGRFGLHQKHLDRVDKFFVKHGGKAVFSSHFLSLLRSLMPFVAGSRRMSYLKFLSFNAMGCVVWASMFVALGYLGGKSWRMVALLVGNSGEFLFGMLLLVIMISWFWNWLDRYETDAN